VRFLQTPSKTGRDDADVTWRGRLFHKKDVREHATIWGVPFTPEIQKRVACAVSKSEIMRRSKASFVITDEIKTARDPKQAPFNPVFLTI